MKLFSGIKIYENSISVQCISQTLFKHHPVIAFRIHINSRDRQSDRGSWVPIKLCIVIIHSIYTRHVKVK